MADGYKRAPARSESVEEHTTATRGGVNMGACNKALPEYPTSTSLAPRCQDEAPPAKTGYLSSRKITGGGRTHSSYSAPRCSRNAASGRPIHSPLARANTRRAVEHPGPQ